MHVIPFVQLSERGQARLDQIEDAADRVREFYRLVAELQGLLARAEEGLNTQSVVGTEVEMIKQQLQEFKVGWSSFHLRCVRNVCASELQLSLQVMRMAESCDSHLSCGPFFGFFCSISVSYYCEQLPYKYKNIKDQVKSRLKGCVCPSCFNR